MLGEIKFYLLTYCVDSTVFLAVSKKMGTSVNTVTSVYKIFALEIILLTNLMHNSSHKRKYDIVIILSNLKKHSTGPEIK